MSELLDRITGPQDVKDLSAEECTELAQELRRFIIQTVSGTGGHLASNLGVVELTIALFRVFDFTDDQIVWDVGHQSYTYKILTGRKDQFGTLRQWNGLAGFPKRGESPYDVFNTGHSSTSISAALGLLRAAQKLGKENHVLAVIGDGALTGGMAYEALNDAGNGDDHLIVILNDNEMSISKNVGGTAKHLHRLRTSRRYRKFKNRLERVLMKIPAVGPVLAKALVAIKNQLRKIFLSSDSTMFEAFGFHYYGPVDGHDQAALERVLVSAKETEGPVLVHISTIKGQGYVPAVSDPQYYHGVAPFEPDTGVTIAAIPDLFTDSEESFSQRLTQLSSFTEAFSQSIQYLALQDERVVGISAAMTGGTGLEPFANHFPERFYDVGIAEQHAVSLAGGMAAGGLKPIVALYSTFLQRALDQAQHDTVLPKLPVVFCLDRSGVVGEDGETHQGLYDLAFLRSLPGGRILAPRDYTELYKMLKDALIQTDEPTFIRYPKGGHVFTKGDLEQINQQAQEVSGGGLGPQAVWLKQGTDLNIIAWGYTSGLAWQAAQVLEAQGISAGVLDLRSLKPLDWENIAIAAELPVLTVEETVRNGSCGQEIAARLSENKMNAIIKCIHIQDAAVLHGKRQIVLDNYGISVDNIVTKALELVSGREVEFEVRNSIRPL